MGRKGEGGTAGLNDLGKDLVSDLQITNEDRFTAWHHFGSL